MLDIQPIFEQYSDFLVALVLTAPRVYAFLDSSQLMNSSTVPGMSRMAAIVSIVMFLSPMNLAYAHEATRALGPVAFLIAKEYAIGVVLGYFVAWILWVVQTAGTFIDNQRGASIA
jgi:type III secretion protein T